MLPYLILTLPSPNTSFPQQIEDGEIFATINQKDGMVRFHDNPEKYNSPNMLLEVDKEVRYSLVGQYYRDGRPLDLSGIPEFFFLLS